MDLSECFADTIKTTYHCKLINAESHGYVGNEARAEALDFATGWVRQMLPAFAGSKRPATEEELNVCVRAFRDSFDVACLPGRDCKGVKDAAFAALTAFQDIKARRREAA